MISMIIYLIILKDVSLIYGRWMATSSQINHNIIIVKCGIWDSETNVLAHALRKDICINFDDESAIFPQTGVSVFSGKWHFFSFRYQLRMD